MKLALSPRSNWSFVAISAAVAFSFAASNTAQAFTFEGQADANSEYRGFTDLQLPGKSNLDSHSSQFDSKDGAFKSGSTTLQFGAPQTFDQRYNPSNLFDPFARDGR
jgi:hypothetical protein